MLLQAPKGMKDVTQREKLIKDFMHSKFVSVYERHGAVPIETPTVELRELLTNKYGEDEKLIFNLCDDDTTQQLSLRYDLSVPFVRYLAQNKISTLKKYHIGKVYRRDNPSIATGRFREFLQYVF